MRSSDTFESMTTQWQYEIQQLGAGHTYKNTAGMGGLQMMLNDMAKQGWEYVESQAAFDGNGRLYIFRRDTTANPGST
jgi:hypothetical protein